MISDSDLVFRLREIVRCSDLRTTTAAGLRRRLEEEFNVDLYGRRAFINEQIDIFLQDDAAQDDEQEPEEKVDEDIQNDVAEKGREKKESENQNESDRDEEISEEEEDEDEKEEDDDEDVDDDEDEDEESNDEDNNRKKRSTEMDAEVKKKKGGFYKTCALSPQLQKFLGVPNLSRTEVLRKIWSYIREKNLQNPKDKKKILCDESLREIFRVKCIGMFQMNKVLSKHIWPLDEPEAAQVKSRKVRRCRQDLDVGSDELKRKEKRRKGGGSG